MSTKTFKTNESYKHKLAKELLFKWIVDGKVGLKDQLGEIHFIHNEFIAIETPVLKNLDEHWVPFHEWSSCFECSDPFNYKEHKLEYMSEEYIKMSDEQDKLWDENFKSIKERCNNNLYKKGDSDFNGYYSLHPCNGCKFLNTYNFKFIFDIGVGYKGIFVDAIEVENTSSVKDEKLLYCIKNNIRLLEVKVIREYMYMKSIVI